MVTLRSCVYCGFSSHVKELFSSNVTCISKSCKVRYEKDKGLIAEWEDAGHLPTRKDLANKRSPPKKQYSADEEEMTYDEINR